MFSQSSFGSKSFNPLSFNGLYLITIISIERGATDLPNKDDDDEIILLVMGFLRTL